MKLYTKSFLILAILFFSSPIFSNELSSNISLFSIKSKSESWWQNNNNYGFDIRNNYLTSSIFWNNDFLYFESDGFLDFQKEKVHFKYLNINYIFNDNVNLKIGRYGRQFSEYLEDRLSSGSMIESLNAQPIPKIGLYYTSNFNKKSNFQLKLGMSHGQFDRNSYYKSAPYLHEKFLYLTKKENGTEFGIGLVHEAMWAGNILIGKHPGKQPSSFKDFLKVFISADGPLKEGEVHANALGNHLGIWDFYFIRELSAHKFKIYYQHIFEDTSSFRFANKSDGLWGFQYDNLKFKSGFLLEYLNTTNCCIDPPYQSDNYYYNYQYRSGWRYKNNIIGNPFVNPTNSIYVDLIKLVHLGFYIKTDEINLLILNSRKVNIEDNHKSMLKLEKKMNKSISLDILIFNDEKNTNYGLGVNYHF